MVFEQLKFEIFSQQKWDLSDGINFSQQKLTFCCLQSQFYKKLA